MNRRCRTEHGFSLVELLIAMSILLVVLIATLSFLDSFWRHSSDLDRQAQQQNEARLALAQLVADTRQAYTGDPATPAVQAISATTWGYYSPDRATPYRLRLISYRVNGSNLERSVTVSQNTGGPPWTFGATSAYVVVAHGVVNTTVFTARDATGGATTTPAAVRRVDVRLQVDANPKYPPPPQTYETTVEIRSGP